jgi:hypothetical protein
MTTRLAAPAVRSRFAPGRGLDCTAIVAFAALALWSLMRVAGAIDRPGLAPARRGAGRLGRRLHDSHYCTACGWLNAPLERIGFFRKLERCVRGFAPRAPLEPASRQGPRA